MCNNLGSCFKKDKKKKKKREERHISLESPSEFAKRTGPKLDIDTTGLAEKTERVVETTSNINHLKTTEITQIYRLPCEHYTTVEEITAFVGYEILKSHEIGKGATAIVYRARRLRDGRICACKVMISESPKEAKNAKNELFIMERIRHPHIVRFYKHFIVETAHRRQVYIFMQLAEGGSLKNFMKKAASGLAEDTCRRMFAQIVSAINHMHKKGIAHRDLKIANILLDGNGNCLVSDFGLSRLSRTRSGEVIMLHKFDGTVHYMAPEILLNKSELNQAHVDYDPFLVDIWAAGVILFFLIYCGYPFSLPINLEELLAQQIQFRRDPTKEINTFDPSPQLIKLITQMLEPATEKRITMDGLMAHSWIRPNLELIEAALATKDKKRSMTKAGEEASSNGGGRQTTESTTGNSSLGKVAGSTVAAESKAGGVPDVKTNGTAPGRESKDTTGFSAKSTSNVP